MPRKPAVEGGARVVRVFIVELKVEMPDTPNILVFGSKKAIFEYFGNALRLTYNSAANINFANGYENAVCCISESHLLTLNSIELIERRKREGREPIPMKDPKGAQILTERNKKAMQSNQRVYILQDIDTDKFVKDVLSTMPKEYGAQLDTDELDPCLVVRKGQEQSVADWLKMKGIKCSVE